MRTARVVGLSPDGRSLIVATDRGEELAIAADDRLRAAVRGDRPRLGQLEIEMESALSPREIQARIRSGASLEDVTRVAGVPMERVERFAAPVLAEREHVAATAMTASVRRRGETSGHRNLRITVTERLVSRGVDIDSIDWDSYRLEDGRWTVTADYRSGEAQRHAEFVYDPRGRFSIAGNDEARWLVGEQSSAHGPQPGRRRPPGGPDEDDTEPTLDLNDELALVRATQERPAEPEPQPEPELATPPEPDVAEAAEPTVAVRRPLSAVPPPAKSEPTELAASEPIESQPDVEPAASELDRLDDLLGGGGFSEDPVVAYAGLSDASAVPQVEGGGWEPAIVVDYPIEPSLTDDDPPLEVPGPPEPIVSGADRADEAREFAEESGHPDAVEVVEVIEVREEAPAGSATEPLAIEAVDPPTTPPPPKTGKKKRASVPSWDEIMFGGPKRPS